MGEREQAQQQEEARRSAPTPPHSGTTSIVPARPTPLAPPAEASEHIGITLSISVKLGAGLLALVLWGATTGLYVWLTWSGHVSESMAKFAAEAAATWVAIYVAWHATSTSALERQAARARHIELVRQRDEQHDELIERERRRRAFELMASLDQQDRVDLRMDIRQEFEAIRDDGPKMKAKLEGDDALRKKVAKVMGSFEDLAIAVRSREVDESIIFYSLGSVFIRFYDILRLYIEHLRVTDPPGAPSWYCELEHVARAWRERRSAVDAGTIFDPVKRPWS